MRRRGLDQLRYFVIFVNEMSERHDYAALASSTTISFTRGKGLTVDQRRPDEHHLRSFLIDARRLFMKGEDTDLDVVFPTAQKHVIEPSALQAVIDPAEAYRRLRVRGMISLVVDGDELRPAELTDLVLHGTIFHGTAGKELRFKELTESKPELRAMIEVQVLDFVFRVVEIAIWVASVIQHEDEAGRLR